MEVAEFLRVVRKGDIKKLEELKANGVALDMENRQGVTGWHAAVKAGKMEVAEWFWKQDITSVYAEPWNILACEKYLDYFIKFGGHRILQIFSLTQAMLRCEYKFVEWGIKYSYLSNSQKQMAFIEALQYGARGSFYTVKFDNISLKMVELCMTILPDITTNNNAIMKTAWEERDSLESEIFDYILNNTELINKAIELKQYNFLPQPVSDLFLF